jgi:hypothetical protein
MKFLEKDLETIIYHHTLACCQRGLDIKPHGQAGTLLRQVALGPYGTADLIMLDMDVSPVYAPWEEEGQTFKRSLTITIIECKLEEINTRAYQQAKRYKAALKKLTEYYSSYHTEFVFKVVLIGQTTDRSSDFLFQYMDDPDCSAFTFDYSVDGIQFYPVSKEWRPCIYRRNKLLKPFSEMRL